MKVLQNLYLDYTGGSFQAQHTTNKPHQDTNTQNFPPRRPQAFRLVVGKLRAQNSNGERFHALGHFFLR